MLTYRCRVSGCDHLVEDGQHVDDVLDKIHTHYRAQHPRKAFYSHRTMEEIEVFNYDLNDFFQSQYGPGWQGLERARLERSARILLRDGQDRYYCQELIDEARAFVGNAPDPDAAANEVPAGRAGNLPDNVIWDVIPPLGADF